MTAAQQLEHFIALFPGRYDSTRQWSDMAGSDERNYRRHSIFRRVDLPAFGEVVFLAHQYRDGDPEAVYRQRLYTLTHASDRDDAAFRLRVHVPKQAELLSGAYRDPSRLLGLLPDEFTVWDGCDLFWSWKDDLFTGTLDAGACRFTSEAFGQEIVLEETLTLSADRITFADRGLSLAGDWLFGMRGTIPNVSLKVRPFLCSADGQAAWLHDQGGQTDALGYPLRLEQWSGPDSSGLKLTATLTGSEELTMIDRTNSERIAMDVGDDRVICRYAPESLYSEAG